MRKAVFPMNLQYFAEGETEQEVADPAGEVLDSGLEETSDEGETGQEVADPAGGESAAQTPEENARFAAARRAAEDRQRRIDETYARRFGNLQNPATGKPITSAQDYMEALEAQEQMQQMQELQDKGIDPAMLNNLILNNPVMKQAQQMIAAQTERQVEERLSNDLKAISMIDPEIKTIDDLSKQENFEEILSLVKNNGLSVYQAYQLASANKIAKRQMDAAKQAAVNQARGKSHLDPIGGMQQGGQNLKDIPANELHVWKEYYPNLTMDQLKQKYNSVL